MTMFCILLYLTTDLSNILYWVFRAHADWTFILPSELSTKVLRRLPRKMPPQAYQTSQYVVPRGAAFFSASGAALFAGSSDCKMNVQSACALSTLYNFKYAHLDVFKSNYV
jgi:hypothetical protein